MKLEAGKCYRDRGGKVHGPLEPALYARFPFRCKGVTWTLDGCYYRDGRSTSWDLIEEVVDEPKPSACADKFFAGQVFTQHGAAEIAAARITEAYHKVYDEPAVEVKTAITNEALAIVSRGRNTIYGEPEDNFERIARFWKAYFENTGRPIELNAADVSPLMRLMKEARLCNTPDHRDSFVDLIGYALTGAEINGVKAEKT